jgi:hypothetical protein
MAKKRTDSEYPDFITNRRSGLDRRWIIAPHDGQERRSGKDRRSDMQLEESSLQSQEALSEELAVMRDLLMANSIQLDALAQLLIEKGVFTKEQFFGMLKRVQAEYEKKGETEN